MKLYRAFLLLLIVLLVAALASCAGTNDKATRSDSSATAPSGLWKGGHVMRLLLAGVEARDSAAIITEFYVDQTLRQAADSIAAAEYVTINYRDSLAQRAIDAGKKGAEISELGEKLNLDGVIYTNFARFSSVLGVDFRIVEPKTGKLLFRDVDFTMIRYRDTTGTMFLGPAIYEAMYKALGRYFGMEHTAAAPVATEPLIVASVVMDNDPRLKRLAELRDQLSHDGVAALGEYARAGFRELVAFDIASRDEVFQLVNVGAVNDNRAMSGLERQALYNLGVDRYVTAQVTPVAGDSVQFRVEIRGVVSAARDTLVDAEQQTVPVGMFATTTIDEDFVRTLLEVAQPLYTREAERIKDRYNNRQMTTASAGSDSK